MPFNQTEIENTLQEWVADFTGLDPDSGVIWAEQNAPQPSNFEPPESPYITLRMASLTPQGQDFWSNVDDATGKAKVGGVRRFTLEVNHYGPGSFAMLEALYGSLIFPEYQKLLNDVGITQLDRFPVQNLTGLDDTQFEERALATFWFLIGTQSHDGAEGVFVSMIDKVEVDETIKTYDGSILHEETIVIPET